MFWNPPKDQPLKNLARELLFHDWHERDREARFATAAWQALFAHPEFPKLSFASKEHHRASTLELASALYAIAHGGFDLPFVASVAAQCAIVPEMLAPFASAERKTQFLAAVQSGNCLAAICNSEDGSGTNLRAMKSVCRLSADGQSGVLNAVKPLATNAYGADFVIASAWSQGEAGKPTLELFLTERAHFQSQNVAPDLTGFRTGNCGALKIHNAPVDLKRDRLGENGIATIKHCFDAERWYLGVIVAGVLHATEDAALERLAKKPALQDKQYVQEKILAVHATRIKLLSLASSALMYPQLAQAQSELSLLKWICAEEAPAAVQAAADLNGWSGMTGKDILNKTARDFQALRYFGGTAELQKMNLFGWLGRPREAKDAKAA